MTNKKYKVIGMHCTSCAMMIEGELEDIGVNAKCSYALQTVEVQFDDKKITAKDIENAVKKAGYRLNLQ
jgi:Cu+-exporting ATPase